MIAEELHGVPSAREQVLEQVLLDIALLADGHRSSRAYDQEGRNIALCVVLAMAADAIGLADHLRQEGTLFSTCAVDRPHDET